MQQERFLRSARQARNFFHLILPSVNIFMYLAHALLTPCSPLPPVSHMSFSAALVIGSITIYFQTSENCNSV